MAVLSFQSFVQLSFFCDGRIGAHTSLSQKTFMNFGSFMNLLWVFWKCHQICWVKNILLPWYTCSLQVYVNCWPQLYLNHLIIPWLNWLNWLVSPLLHFSMVSILVQKACRWIGKVGAAHWWWLKKVSPTSLRNALSVWKALCNCLLSLSLSGCVHCSMRSGSFAQVWWVITELGRKWMILSIPLLLVLSSNDIHSVSTLLSIYWSSAAVAYPLRRLTPSCVQRCSYAYHCCNAWLFALLSPTGQLWPVWSFFSDLSQ